MKNIRNLIYFGVVLVRHLFKIFIVNEKKKEIVIINLVSIEPSVGDSTIKFWFSTWYTWYATTNMV